jgi:hypothetical protein
VPTFSSPSFRHPPRHFEGGTTEKSPAIDDRAPFLLKRQDDVGEIPARTGRNVRAGLSRASFGMTLGLAERSNEHHATSNKLNFSTFPDSPDNYRDVRPKRFTLCLCVFAVPKTLNFQTLNLQTLNHQQQATSNQ